MDCHKAGEYMMKFMDETLTAREACELERHAERCPECAGDFAVYKSIMADFARAELIDAPEGFEEAVMEKIRALPAISKPSEIFDNIVYGVWGVFSVLIGAGFALFLNKDAILAGMAQNTAYVNFMALISPIYAFAAGLAADVSQGFRAFMSDVSAYSVQIRYAVVAVFVALAAVQFFVHRKETVKTR